MTMATSAPSSPTRRRVSPVEADADEQAPGLQPTSRATRSPQRLGTSEIPRTYSGMYGEGAPPMPDIRSERDDGDEDDDEDGGGSALSPPGADPSSSSSFSPPSSLLPFELSRNRNTEWLAASGPALLATYLSVIVACLLTLLAYVDEPKAAWTAGNALHVLVSIVYLHWIKGNPADFMDGTQGEMNAMTTWEQIVCKPASHLEDPGGPAAAARAGKSRNLREIATAAVRRLRSRDVLVVVPTLLALASCYVAEFQFEYAMANVGMWACLMLPKMPAMNGVRILGINRTAGIDDGEEECLDAEVDAAKGGIQEANESKKDR